MEYLKLTAIMKEKNGQLAGIVSLQKINGDVMMDWSVGQLNPNDELVFTMQGGKKVQFSSLAKRGKKKVYNACVEFKCEMMRSGNVVATGMTSKYVQNDMNVINYVNAFANNAKTILKANKEEQNEKIGDIFDGKVATYNYYENELPKGVANDASAIVSSFENKTAIQSKTEIEPHADDAAKIETKMQPLMPKEKAMQIEKAVRPNDKPTEKKKMDEKDVRTDKNLKIPSKADEESNDDCYDNRIRHSERSDEIPDIIEEQRRQEIEDSTDQIFGGLKRDENQKDENQKQNSIKEEKESKKKQSEPDDEEESERDEDEMTKKWNEDNATFYETIAEQLDDLFAKFPKDTYLNEIIPSSKWAKVTYDESGRTYSVGILTDGEDVLFVGYGVIADYSEEPPKELNPNAQWVPLNFTKPHGKGYWMLYQSAKDGTNV